MTTRRGFLRMLGIGAAAAPTIGSEVIGGLQTLPPSHLPYAYPLGAGPTTAGNAAKSIPASALRIIGVPDWLREEWRDRARYVQVFDPDIAAMKSMSQAAKIYHQRERNEKAEEERFFGRGLGFELRRKFFDKHGYIDGY